MNNSFGSEGEQPVDLMNGSNGTDESISMMMSDAALTAETETSGEMRDLDERKRRRSNLVEDTDSDMQVNPSPSLQSSTSSMSPLPVSGIPDFPETRLEVVHVGEHLWRIERWNDLVFEEESGYARSPEFEIGGCKWCVLMRMGTDKGRVPSVFLFLEVADKARRTEENVDWAVCAEMTLAMRNPEQPETGVFAQSSFHRYCAGEPDWGFSPFCAQSALNRGTSETSGVALLSSTGSLEIVVRVRIVKDPTGVLWHSFNDYNSKKATGYVGLQNQGATCYMNSFLQSIYLTNEFRKAVYNIPTDKCEPTSSIPLALQRIFYKLQTMEMPPSTTELTKSFGWDTTESFMQHDVQEFSRVLLDDLENKMKGSEVEGTVERLFRGKLKNVLRCENVDYESTREESFYDLQLTIKGVKDLKESFERYVAAEMLCGDNQYRTDEFGLQDAKKFVVFEHLPPVLHVHLERYAFDLMAEQTVKIHDRFEFPTEINLDSYLSETSPDRSISQEYWLHSVLVHSGDGHGGHYFVFIRHPSNPGRWYKFDDTRVVACTEKEAVEDNFGGDEAGENERGYGTRQLRLSGIRPNRFKKYTSAYLLVYIRRADLENVLVPVEESDVPRYLVEKIKADDEAEARARHERQQQYLMMKMNVLTDDSIAKHRGGDLYSPELKEDDQASFFIRFQRDATLQEFRDDIVEKLQVDLEAGIVEAYSLMSRRNRTIRVDDFIWKDEASSQRPLGIFSQKFNSMPAPAFYFRYVPKPLTGHPEYAWNRPMQPGLILIMFKWYSPKQKLLLPLTMLAVRPDMSVKAVFSDLKAFLLTKNLLNPDQIQVLNPIVYEELKPSKITLLDHNKTFAENELRHGDILIVQDRNELVNEDMNGDDILVTPVDYFDDLLSWVSVLLKPYRSSIAMEDEGEGGTEALSMNVCTKWSFGELVNKVAERLNEEGSSSVGADHVRLILSDPNTDIVSSAIPSTTTATVRDIFGSRLPMFPSIVSTAGNPITLYFEVTEIPVQQLENMVKYSVNAGQNCPESLLTGCRNIYLPPFTSTVNDLLQSLNNNNSEILGNVRLLECLNGKIQKCWREGSDLLMGVSEDSKLYLELPGVDELENDCKLISVFQYNWNPARTHGIPFKFPLLKGESLTDLRNRLSQRLNLPTNPTATSLPLSLFSWGRERRLEDETEILYDIPEIDGESEQLGVMIGEQKGALNRPSSGFDGAIRFRTTPQP